MAWNAQYTGVETAIHHESSLSFSFPLTRPDSLRVWTSGSISPPPGLSKRIAKSQEKSGSREREFPLAQESGAACCRVARRSFSNLVSKHSTNHPRPVSLSLSLSLFLSVSRSLVLSSSLPSNTREIYGYRERERERATERVGIYNVNAPGRLLSVQWHKVDSYVRFQTTVYA